LEEETMKADLEIYALDPNVIVMSDQQSQLIIRCEMVDQLPAGPKRNGKYVHLTMTMGQAMRLLSMLQGVQHQYGLASEPPATIIPVPPTKDRN
jgi:hypothetical protein